MIAIEFSTILQVVRDPGMTDADLHAQIGQIMDELLILEAAGCGITDAAVSLDMGVDHVTVELLASGADFDAAHLTAVSSLRSAIHAAGASTPQAAWAVLDRRAELVDA